MPHLFLPRSRRAASDDGIVASARHPFGMTLADLFDRTTLLRCALLTLASLAVGLLLMWLWLPTLPADLMSGILDRHLPGETARPLVWLRLCGARLPVLALLAAAGLTRFSGGLTSALLIFRGLCDGTAIALATSSLQGMIALPNGKATPVTFLLALCIWALIDAAVRTILAAEARRFARETAASPMPVTDPEDRARLRYRLWRYATFASAALLLTLLSTAGYLLVLGI